MTMSAVSSILWWHHLNNMKFCQRSTCNFENNAQTDRQHCLESLCQFIDVNWNQCVSEWMSVSVSRLKFVDKVIIITKHHQFHLLVILSLCLIDSSTFLLPEQHTHTHSCGCTVCGTVVEWIYTYLCIFRIRTQSHETRFLRSWRYECGRKTDRQRHTETAKSEKERYSVKRQHLYITALRSIRVFAGYTRMPSIILQK